jgi:hypothetical protein
MRKQKRVTKAEIEARMKKGQYFFLSDGTCMTYAVNKLFEKYAGYSGLEPKAATRPRDVRRVPPTPRTR